MITATYDGPAGPLLPTVEQLGGVHRVEQDDRQLRVFAAQADGLIGDLVDVGSRAGLALRDVASLPPSLEAVFLTLTGREYLSCSPTCCPRSAAGWAGRSGRPTGAGQGDRGPRARAGADLDARRRQDVSGAFQALVAAVVV